MIRTYGRSVHTTTPLYVFAFQILPWRSHFEPLYGVKGLSTIPVSPQSSYIAYLYGTCTGYVVFFGVFFPIVPSYSLCPSPSNSLTSHLERPLPPHYLCRHGAPLQTKTKYLL
ncbi:hypothetical protein HOY80DRAFT_77036 [Tuber brumale]|nr:hypothetical protein HOY80DRAFT_77036 [Tuber brumale]